MGDNPFQFSLNWSGHVDVIQHVLRKAPCIIQWCSASRHLLPGDQNPLMDDLRCRVTLEILQQDRVQVISADPQGHLVTAMTVRPAVPHVPRLPSPTERPPLLP